MGRPPCCDKVGIKKGPWTPEEDIILVSYIQEHGPGNWRSVPTNTGLLRCSKSCRLRWTNYLRPGIKRGNFTPHEEGMIIHLQALLGNKWAAIASYLPQRTDNDIKNYWNTHLKKKMKKFQSTVDPLMGSVSVSVSPTAHHLVSKNYNEKKRSEFSTTSQGSQPRYGQATSYASSTENISRLLEGWMKSSPKAKAQESDSNCGDSTTTPPHKVEQQQESCDLISHEEFESLLTFDNMGSMGWDKSSSDSSLHGPTQNVVHTDDKTHVEPLEVNRRLENPPPPMSFLEKWLLDESGGHVEGLMDLSAMSDNFPTL